ncbi:MAG: hypothetical protein L3K19_06255 [Thermoplasmata archaeon]|nr:hypothetical protein [Thermoplasmata archaeon]
MRPPFLLRPSGRRGRLLWGIPLFGLAVLPLVVLALLSGPFGHPTANRIGVVTLADPASASSSSTAAAPANQTPMPTITQTPQSGSNAPAVTLHIQNTPQSICALGGTGCPAGNPVSRVTLSAIAGGAAAPAWPDVEVAFVIETTAYDGVYNHGFFYYGTDKCARANPGAFSLPCEESNGVPFFMANAGSIANAIQAANPHSHVTFALVDFFATDGGDWDDGLFDGSKYHVDISNFVAASEFGADVVSTFQDGVFGGGWSGVIGLDDNFLHSPAITSLYGAIIGSGLTWSGHTHHVIVLMGSTAPRDPHYVENYYVSPFDSCCGGTQANGWTCEPSFQFGVAVSPNCEGWVTSQDGNPKDSIAALAHNSPTCSDSVGGVCTIDTITLWTTPSDPLSPGWPVGPRGGGPGGPLVQANVNHVIAAACDLAAATGGSWDGPAYAACPDGQAGDLQFVPHGAWNNPDTQNPTLMNALRHISFGPIYNTLVANGTAQPLFTYVPFGNIKVASNPQFAASCQLPSGEFERSCQTVPTPSVQVGGLTTYGWNWSTNHSQNALYIGDTWTASFNVVDTGPPYTTVPVDACITVECKAGGSGAVDGYYTSATYRPYTNTSTVIQSFPLATVNVGLSPSIPGQSALPPPPPPPPAGIPITVSPAVPVVSPIGTLTSVGVANVSLQATAAGFLGAGFIRVSMKNKPIAMRMAAMSGKVTSKFEKAQAGGGPGVGRFE